MTSEELTSEIIKIKDIEFLDDEDINDIIKRMEIAVKNKQMKKML